MKQYLMMKYGERYINRRSDCFLVWMSYGWALLRMGFSVRLNDKIKKTHFENFPGEGKVLYMMDDLEGEDAFLCFSRRRSLKAKMDTIYIMKKIR